MGKTTQKKDCSPSPANDTNTVNTPLLSASGMVVDTYGPEDQQQARFPLDSLPSGPLSHILNFLPFAEATLKTIPNILECGSQATEGFQAYFTEIPDDFSDDEKQLRKFVRIILQQLQGNRANLTVEEFKNSLLLLERIMRTVQAAICFSPNRNGMRDRDSATWRSRQLSPTRFFTTNPGAITRTSLTGVRDTLEQQLVLPEDTHAFYNTVGECLACLCGWPVGCWIPVEFSALVAVGVSIFTLTSDTPNSEETTHDFTIALGVAASIAVLLPLSLPLLLAIAVACKHVFPGVAKMLINLTTSRRATIAAIDAFLAQPEEEPVTDETIIGDLEGNLIQVLVDLAASLSDPENSTISGARTAASLSNITELVTQAREVLSDQDDPQLDALASRAMQAVTRLNSTYEEQGHMPNPREDDINNFEEWDRFIDSLQPDALFEASM